MIVHNKIRQEVIDFLAEKIQEVTYFHNGLPKILNLDDELPMIAVYLNNAEGNPVTIGHIEWEAELMVLTYLPFNQGEAVLDEINEKINHAILSHDFSNFSLTADFNQTYDYEYDTENNAWVSAALSYRIQYQYQPMNPFHIENQEEA